MVVSIDRNKRIFLIILITFFLICTSSYPLQAMTLKSGSQTENLNKIICLNNDVVPEWKIDNLWKYDFNFKFKCMDKYKLEGKIKNLQFKVIDKTEEEYKLKLTGELDSDIEVFGLDLLDFDGDVTGTAYVKRSTLGINSFSIKSDGGGFLMSSHANLEIDFASSFDFLDLPISEKESAWSAYSNGNLEGCFNVKLLGIDTYTYPILVRDIFKAERLHYVSEGDHTVPAGEFYSYKISGNLAPEYDGESSLWYSPEAGFLVDMLETGKGSQGSDVSLRMQLKSTNYEAPEENNPPNKPNTPCPSNHADGVSLDSSLFWKGGDPDSDDTVKYDVYFGEDSTPDSTELVSEKQSATSYTPSALEPDTTYYWKIIAHDNNDGTTEGNIWKFSTGENTENRIPCELAIDGPKKVIVPEIETYGVVAVDPDGDNIGYLLKVYMNGAPVGGLTAAGKSGETVYIDVPFAFEGTYVLKLQATDGISGLSEEVTLSITAPKEKTFNPSISDFLNQVLDRFQALRSL